MIARRSRKRKPVWIVYVEGLMDKVMALSWKGKEKMQNFIKSAHQSAGVTLSGILG